MEQQCILAILTTKNTAICYLHPLLVENAEVIQLGTNFTLLKSNFQVNAAILREQFMNAASVTGPDLHLDAWDF